MQPDLVSQGGGDSLATELLDLSRGGHTDQGRTLSEHHKACTLSLRKHAGEELDGSYKASS